MQIHGDGFRSPVRVLFNDHEAFVVFLTENRIGVATPAVSLPLPDQQLVADVHVITEAGTSSEQRSTAPRAFTFRSLTLTPRIATVSPSSGSLHGGLRLTIFGDGFEAPAAVYFLAANGRSVELRVIDVQFGQIVVETPPAADLGVEPGEAIDLRVWNINSNLDHVLREAFRYRANMTVDSISPSAGPATGGTDVQISGSGFTIPSHVTVAGTPATLVRVSSTQMLARTQPVETNNCRDVVGPVRVIDLASGELAEGPGFTYVVQPVRIIDVAPRVAGPGERIEVTLANANSPFVDLHLGALGRRSSEVIGSRAHAVVPSEPAFPRAACTYQGIAGVAPQPFTINIAVTDRAGCHDVVPDAVTIRPREPVVCALPPAATVVAPAEGQCLRFGRVDGPRTGWINIVNRDVLGTTALRITGVEVTGPAKDDFEVAIAANPFAPAGGRIPLQVTFRATTRGYRIATVVLHTNDPARPVIEICLRAWRL